MSINLELNMPLVEAIRQLQTHPAWKRFCQELELERVTMVDDLFRPGLQVNSELFCMAIGQSELIKQLVKVK